ncbi:vWA domain-containing protein [Streptomyces sp. TRM70350]|uniref:vWA domain-containing protein n=1 Tax=Streptomyces sp. TRM70350 TaxID=2856165 RepID=UPI001C44904B|nr:vWA domain-containing protein [Streptomyces sp. TRM70350]MBV7700095.1 VWA domain-containing protein [Streptomyces sp. TRM70350]
MTAFKLSAADTRLVTATGPGLVADNRLAVSPSRLTDESAAVLQVHDTGGTRSVAVRLLPAPGVPADVIVAPAALVQEHRVTPEEGWELASADAVVPAMLELELPPGPSLDDAATLLRGAPLLCGHVFAHGFEASPDVWIDASGTLFLVRQALDHGGRPLRGLLRVGPETRLTLFAPGERSGVDIVVLADCSGSMSIEDIPATVGDEGNWLSRLRTSTSRTTISRMHALKDALGAMIDARMRYDGVGTRFALVRFDHDHEPMFPSRWGMEEVSDPHSVQRLREAVSLLNYRQSGTDIGKALHKAGELLHRYGVPGNERLVVLVSDGAHFAPLPDERSGESVSGTQDPVSLMEDLHAGLGIRLHAVGISDEALFDRWWQSQRHRPGWTPQAHESMVPNHRMLGELVTVAGGDRQRIGGLDVLEKYFAELGSGVVRAVGRPARPRLPALQLTPGQLAAEPQRRATTDPRQRRTWEASVEDALVAYSRVCEASRARLGYQLLRSSPPDDFARLRRQCADRADFTAWLSVAYQVFNERLHGPLRIPKKDPAKVLDLPQLAAPFWDGRMSQLHELRNFYHHDRDMEERAERNRIAGGIIHKHTGSYAPLEDDADAWHALQLGLVRDLAALLNEAHAILNAAPDPEPATPEDPAPAAQASPAAAGGIRIKSQGYD